MTDKELLIDIRDRINEHLSNPVSDIRASFLQGTRVHLTWKALSDGDMDIRYHIEGEKEWKYSVKKYTKKYINIEDENIVIGFNQSVEKAHFKFVSGGWESEPITLEKPLGLFYHGFWDHYTNQINLPDDLLPYVNVGKSMQRKVDGISVKNIPHIGGLKAVSQDERKKRIADTKGFLNDETLIVHLEDEPLSHITADELDELADYAKTQFDVPVAITVDLYELLNFDLPQKVDYIFYQAYPYRSPSDTENQAFNIGDSKQELFDELDLRLSQLQEKSPAKNWIIGQGFHGGKWRTPPVEAMGWYIQWCRANVEGLLWWKWSSSDWMGLNEMAELEEAIIDELMELNYDVMKLPLQQRSEVRLRIRKHSKNIFRRIIGVAGDVLEEILEIAVQAAIKEVEQIIAQKLN